jgi:hypothetical protein
LTYVATKETKREKIARNNESALKRILSENRSENCCGKRTRTKKNKAAKKDNLEKTS